MQKSEGNLGTLQVAAECHSMNKNQCLMKTSSSSENAKKWENFETLQLAAECQSMNKNQSFIKIRPEVPKKMPKSEKICETLQLAAEYHSMT